MEVYAMKVYDLDIIEMVNRNCKKRIELLEKMLAEHRAYMAKKYPSN